MIPDTNLSARIDLFVSCKNVPKLDVMSPSDPFVVFSMRNNQNEEYQIFEYSEIVWDNSNPDFVKQIQIDYLFEEVQRIKLDFYDADTNNQHNLSEHDYIGSFEFLVGDLVTANGQKLTGQLRKPEGNKVYDDSKRPTIGCIRCEEVSANRDEMDIQFSAKNLPKMDWFFGKCDGYLTLYRGTEDGGWAAVAQTNVVKKNYNPMWDPMKVSVQRLCNGDTLRPILIKAFDWSPNAEPDYIGECETTVQDLEAQVELELREVTKGKRGKKSRGTININRVNIRQRSSFLDYIMGGLDIQLMVAVDFTASNGDPRDPQSLHYMSGGENQYSAAIRAVGAVLEPYDSDNLIPCWGFGGKKNGQVRHCFPLNGNESNPEVQGMAGVLQAYRESLSQYQLSGPTLFSEIIGTATMLSTYPQTEQQHFTLLMIITDGVINDVQKTIDSIVNASSQPIAIIIIGVGNADFSTMDVLDADDEPLVNTRGVKAQADVVQFVPFNKYRGLHSGMLAKEVLMEVPDQVTGYFERNGIKAEAKKAALQKYQSYGSLPDMGRNPSVSGLFDRQASAPSGPGGMMANPPPPAYNKQPTLPTGWEKCSDPNTARIYYVNHNDQTTHWDLPPQPRSYSMM